MGYHKLIIIKIYSKQSILNPKIFFKTQVLWTTCTSDLTTQECENEFLAVITCSYFWCFIFNRKYENRNSPILVTLCWRKIYINHLSCTIHIVSKYKCFNWCYTAILWTRLIYCRVIVSHKWTYKINIIRKGIHKAFSYFFSICRDRFYLITNISVLFVWNHGCHILRGAI